MERRTFLKGLGLTAAGALLERVAPGSLKEGMRFWREAYAAETFGWFPQTGFAVRADFWREFQRFGGVSNLGYPISRVFEKDSFPHQAFQRAILQWRKESMEAVPVNIMDELHKMGKDGWLYALGVPKHRIENVQAEERLSWLTHPDIKKAYWGNPYPLVFYGLPTSYPERFGPFITQRFQRGVLQLWLDEVSAMPSPGMVVGALVGDWAKEAGFIPQPALKKEEPPKRETISLPSVIYHGERDKPLVALTIDDAGSAYWVEQALGIARNYGVRMSLFPRGDVIARQANLWRQAVAEGHEIGNHTFGHQQLPGLSNEQIAWQIQASQNVLDQALGFHYPMRLLRPPGGAGGYPGAVDPRLLRIAQNLGYSLTMWSLDSGGTNPTNFPYTDPKPIIAQVLPRLQNGEIILLHFNGNDIGALPTIIEAVRKEDLQPVTISELFS